MEKIRASESSDRSRRFLLLLPLITLPFILATAWLLGVGKGTTSTARQTESKVGLIDLPGTLDSNRAPRSKLERYEESLKGRVVPIDDNWADFNLPESQATDIPKDTAQWERHAFVPMSSEDVEKTGRVLFGKLEELQRQMEDPLALSENHPLVEPNDEPGVAQPGTRSQAEWNIAHTGTEAVEDRELAQLNEMLDKVLDIQYPDRVRESSGITDSAASQPRSQVQIIPPSGRISVLSAASTAGPQAIKGFHSIQEPNESRVEPINALPVAVHQTQTLSDGSVLKMRLQQPVMVQGHQIPGGHILYGKVQPSAGRMEVLVSNIRVGNSLYPVKLRAHDMDGMRGLNIPESKAGKEMSEATQRSVETLGTISPLDPTWGAKAAEMGVRAAKGLLSGRIKHNRVTVTEGYRLLLLPD